MSRYLITPSPARFGSSLLLSLDAKNTASYPGSGTTWFDISGKGLNVFLVSTSYTSDAGGGIVFNSGSFGGLPVGLNFNRGGFSISVWLKHTGTVSTGRVQRYVSIASTSSAEGPVLRHNASSAANLHGYLFDSNNTYRSIEVNNQVFTNTYYNFIYTYGHSSGFKLYKNSSLVGSLATSITLPTISDGSIGNGSTEFFEGNMYIFQYYNGELSQTEITQHFDTFRGRFGI